MKVLGLFSGMGSLELGFKMAGYDVVASNEVDPTTCLTLKNNFDHDILDTSIHRLSIEKIRKDYGQIDCVVGGFPCKNYSKASDIRGTRVAIRTNNSYQQYAERGGDLFLHFWRAVATLQPQVFVVENVPGMFGASIVRETFRNTPCNRNKLGYYYQLYEGILNALDFGLPQERKRYFFIGTVKQPDGMSQKEVDSLIKQVGCEVNRRRLVVGDVLEDNPEMDMPDYVKNRLAGNYRDRPIITVAGEDAVAPTCVAHYAKDRGTRLIQIDDVIRSYTTTEYARLQGIPDDIELAGSMKHQYLQSGNAVALPVATAIAKSVKKILN